MFRPQHNHQRQTQKDAFLFSRTNPAGNRPLRWKDGGRPRDTPQGSTGQCKFRSIMADQPIYGTEQCIIAATFKLAQAIFDITRDVTFCILQALVQLRIRFE
jgi:hypothetical protein